jgi:HEAT repeat associated with sister chromatid cohesion
VYWIFTDCPQQQVKMAIIRRMQDISPSVRDAAIQLAGNYLASHPEGTQKYLAAISERIMVRYRGTSVFSTWVNFNKIYRIQV